MSREEINGITKELLNELLDYDLDTGIFKWAVNIGFKIKCGDRAGYLKKNGYREIGIHGKYYKEHRLAWIYVNGNFPNTHKYEIDHINLKKDDNRILNLRIATRSNNQHNRSKYLTNTSGYKGVNWNSKSNKWTARITINNERILLGYFDDPKDAFDVYCKAAKSIHKDFSRTK